MIIRARVGTRPAPETSVGLWVEGYLQGVTESVLRILEYRGITVTPENRERITRCRTFNLTEAWLEQAFDVTSAEDLKDLNAYDYWD